MNLKKHIQAKRRSPLVLIASIILLTILIFLIYRNVNDKQNIANKKNTRIIITIQPKKYPKSYYPLLLMHEKKLIQAFTSTVPKDTAFLLHLKDGNNLFQIINRDYKTISQVKIDYKNEEVVFINFN